MLNVYEHFGRCDLSMFIYHEETEAKESVVLAKIAGRFYLFTANRSIGKLYLSKSKMEIYIFAEREKKTQNC